MDKIIIKKSQDADTRSSKGNVTKDKLLKHTLSHISDVKNVGKWLSEELVLQIGNHDHTKVEYIDQFYEDFTSGKQGADFKALPWWKEHMKERHHLNDSVPDDVDLIDVLEMVIDCTVAGLARSGEVYPIEISDDVIKKAINNTKDLIIANTEIVDEDVNNNV